MVLSEFLAAVRQRLIADAQRSQAAEQMTESKWRFAVKNGRLPRPRLNAAHQFDFTQADIDSAVSHFSAKFSEVAGCI